MHRAHTMTKGTMVIASRYRGNEQKQGCCDVTQIVEPDARHASFLDERCMACRCHIMKENTLKGTMSMTMIYVLWHSHEIDGSEEMKMIGVYSSQQMAEAAIERLCHQPGFAKYPDAFVISAYPLDQDHWGEGFMTIEDGEASSEE